MSEKENKEIKSILSRRDVFDLTLSGLSNLNNAFLTYASGAEQQRNYNMMAWQSQLNSEQLALDVQTIYMAGGEEASKIRLEGKRVRGQQRAAMSASGFDVGSESYRKIVEDTERQTEMNAQAILREYADKAAATQFQSKLQGIQSDYYERVGKIEKKLAQRTSLVQGLSGALTLGATAAMGGYNSKDIKKEGK